MILVNAGLQSDRHQSEQQTVVQTDMSQDELITGHLIAVYSKRHSAYSGSLETG
jgi:hypothetical protein